MPDNECPNCGAPIQLVPLRLNQALGAQPTCRPQYVFRVPEHMTLAEIEERAILQHLDALPRKGRLTRAARELGISRSTLWRRVRQIKRDREDGEP